VGGEGCLKALVRKLEGKTYLDDLSMDGNFKLDTKAVGCIGMDWIHLAKSTDNWRPVVNTVMNFRIPQNSRDFLTETLSASREDCAAWSY
jgi:hypothetical protein